MNELYEGFANTKNPMSRDEIAILFDRIDVDKSGHIDYTEFIAATMNISEALSDKNMARAFAKFDTDNSGKIDTSELKNVLGITGSDKQMNAKL